MADSKYKVTTLDKRTFYWVGDFEALKEIDTMALLLECQDGVLVNMAHVVTMEPLAIQGDVTGMVELRTWDGNEVIRRFLPEDYGKEPDEDELDISDDDTDDFEATDPGAGKVD